VCDDHTVIGAFRAVATRHGIIASDNFFGTLGASHKDKHPDLIVYRPQADKKPLVIDFSVVHQYPSCDSNRARKMFTAKCWKYRDWHKQAVDFTAFVATTAAIIPKPAADVLDGLSPLATQRGFAREASNRIKIALVRYEITRYKALHARQLANRLIPAEDAPQHASDDSDNSTSSSDTNDSDDDVVQHAQHASRTRNTHTPSVA
jgi:hypothetical protein